MAAISVPQTIIENSTYHAGLMSSIAELDYVTSALSQQTAYIIDLEAQFLLGETRLKKLSQTTKKERKEHEDLRDSTARRLAHKVTGRKEKFKARENKEEREYVEALERELTERDSQNVLRRMVDEAKQVHAELSHNATRYESLKAELANLYSQIFDGPTEAFPEDDELEYKLQSAQSLHDQIQGTLNSEAQAADILARADRTMGACQNKMQEASGYSQWDMWGGGGMSDMMERNALSVAQSLAAQVEMLVRQAQNVSPFVQHIGHLAIAQGSLMSDVFFDNIFTDMAFHNRITASAADLSSAHSRLKVERDAASHRAETAGAQLIEAARTLEERRGDLDSFRRQTFQRVAAHQNGLAPSSRPPSYHMAVSTPVASPTALTSVSGPELAPPTPPAPAYWGSRNPYAAALAGRVFPDQEDGR